MVCRGLTCFKTVSLTLSQPIIRSVQFQGLKRGVKWILNVKIMMIILIMIEVVRMSNLEGLDVDIEPRSRSSQSPIVVVTVITV